MHFETDGGRITKEMRLEALKEALCGSLEVRAMGV